MTRDCLFCVPKHRLYVHSRRQVRSRGKRDNLSSLRTSTTQNTPKPLPLIDRCHRMWSAIQDSIPVGFEWPVQFCLTMSVATYLGALDATNNLRTSLPPCTADLPSIVDVKGTCMACFSEHRVSPSSTCPLRYRAADLFATLKGHRSMQLGLMFQAHRLN